MCRSNQASARRAARPGLTMIELLIATSIMAIIAGALGALAMSVQAGNQYSYAQNLATQHARVALERIRRTVSSATANEQFPGCVAFSETVGPWEFPDTLVVWHPSGQAADPTGLPLISELVIFCVDPENPNQLLEITIPGDSRPVPPLSDQATWEAGLQWAKSYSGANRVVLTNLLRVAAVDTSGEPTQLRGAVRFDAMQRPTDSQWQSYQSGTIAWEDLPWVQDLYGSSTGLRQNWCRIELQLVPPLEGSTAGGQQPIPFLGSAALYYQLTK